MAGTQANLQPWMDSKFFPFNDRLVEGADSSDDSVFMVDVGGGKGHDMEEVLLRYPGLPGVIVLQDQKDVINEATGLNPRIRTMAHDFFSAQPVKGTLPSLKWKPLCSALQRST